QPSFGKGRRGFQLGVRMTHTLTVPGERDRVIITSSRQGLGTTTVSGDDLMTPAAGQGGVKAGSSQGELRSRHEMMLES
ncbi:hypothetical protein FHS34_006146, partial [Streptomyces echinatus]|nr:hypothetical protein [Streptomyces echinatus]